MSARSSRGRPRSARAHQAVLEATRDLLVSGGYEQLTIEGIASAAGVGRQTVYRWWPSKAALVAEAVLEGYLGFDTDTPPDSGDLRADLTGWLEGVLALISHPGVVPLVQGLTAAAFEHPATAAQLIGQITIPFRDTIRERLDAALAAGQLRAGVDLDAATDALLAMVVLQGVGGTRLGSGASGGAQGYVDVFLHGVAAPGT